MSLFHHTSEARGKVGQRYQEYKDSFAPEGTDYYKPKTRKNAWVTVTAGGATLPAQKNTYDTLYANEEGKPDVILNSVKIIEGGEFGMLRKVEGQFTCLSRAAFETYEPAFCQPQNKLTVKYGYVDSSDYGDASDFVICKYSYNLNDKQQYVCSFTAYGPAPFMGEIDMDIVGNFGDKKITTGGFFKSPVATLPQFLKYVAQGVGESANVDIPDGTIRDGSILIVDNPGAMTPDGMFMKKVYKVLQALGMFSGDASKKMYCTLDWLIKTINTYFLGPNLKEALSGRSLAIGSGTDRTGAWPIKLIGSAFPFHFVLTGNKRGTYGTAEVEEDEKLDIDQWAGAVGGSAINGSSIDIGQILISYEYLASKLFGQSSEKGATKSNDQSTSVDGKKQPPKFSLTTLLTTLYDDLSSATGGALTLGTMENPKDSDQLLVICKNSDSSTIQQTKFRPIAGDGISRTVTVKCDIPSNDAYAVANGAATPNAIKGKTGALTAEEQSLVSKAKSDISSWMATGIAAGGFESEDCDALQSCFKTLVEKASQAQQAKMNIDGHIWPLQLEITIDGTAGFAFGDVVNTDFMPPAYHRAGTSVSFLVLEATHEIANNDWTTKLKTHCHLFQGSK